MLGFLALTYYMGIVEQDAMISYWSVDSVLSTPFPRNFMSHSEFYNILSFVHCCSNTRYPSKAQPGYDPRKKLGKVLPILQEWLAVYGFPYIFQLKKGWKYGMQTFKLCDFTRGYCLKFDLYVKKTSEEVISKCGESYDLVMHLLGDYEKLGI